MKGEVLFEKMTDISDEYIAEAALGDAYGNPRREREENPLIRFVNSGWGVAMICAIVSLIAVVALARWGQTEPPVGYADQFEFSYEITYDTEKAWDGHLAPGETINVQTCITNLGEAFGAYGFSAHAQFVLQEDRSIRLEGYYPVIDAAWHTVKQGQQGYLTTHFFIPKDAVCGVYDLVLSYSGVERIFEGVMTVGESVITSDQFSFSYEMTNMDGSPFTGSLTRGSSFRINTTIVNQGAPFTHMGSSSEFRAHPLFMWSSDHSVTIRTDFISNDDEGPHVIKTGEKWQESFAFTIPDDAPEGTYDLNLSCLGVGQVFEGVLIVEENTPTLSPDTKAFIIESYRKAHPYASEEEVSVRHYYGQLPNGAIVAMIDCGDYTDALWEENVGSANLRYNNGNRITVLYEEKFHTLPEAYEGKLLTDADLADIENLHRQYCPYLYADPDTPSDGA